jgi:hypothetical protein
LFSRWGKLPLIGSDDASLVFGQPAEEIHFGAKLLHERISF